MCYLGRREGKGDGKSQCTQSNTVYTLKREVFAAKGRSSGHEKPRPILLRACEIDSFRLKNNKNTL